MRRNIHEIYDYTKTVSITHLMIANTTSAEKQIWYMADNAVIINKVHKYNAEHSVIETIEW